MGWRDKVKPLTMTISLSRQFEADAASTAVSLDDLVTELSEQGLKRSEIVSYMTEQYMSGRGPIADLRASMKSTTAGAVSRTVSIDAAREASEGDAEAMGVWTTTGGSNVCPGCDARHGEEMTRQEFETLHGTHECGARCYCFWIPGKVSVSEATIKMKSIQREHPEWFGL